MAEENLNDECRVPDEETVKQPAPWNECVVIGLPDADHELLIGSARQADAFLRTSWPGSRSAPTYHAAMAACQEAMNGHVPGYLARIAFEQAALHARILR